MPREHHLRGYVHVVEHLTLVLLSLLTVTTGYVLLDEVTFLVQRGVSLCYMVVIFLISGHIYNILGNAGIVRISFVDLAVRSLYETVLVDSCIACKRVDQTDVRSLRVSMGHILP